MMHLVSAFRNASGRLAPYFAQVDALRTLAPDTRVMAVVGDSEDDTVEQIHRWADADQPQYRNSWFRYDHGRPEYGSTEVPDRLQALSGLLNASLDELQRYITDTDTVIWLEGDTFWSPYLPLELARFLRRDAVDVVAPMIFAGEAFYDTFAFRQPDETRWGPFWPWGLITDFTDPRPLAEVGSVGSCVAMRGVVAKTIRVSDNYALVGWCRAARAAGHRVWVAKDLRVQHPCDLEGR